MMFLGSSTSGGPFATLAYRPFIDPINVHEHWYLLLVPVAFFIAVAYKAVRVADMRDYWRQVGAMTVQIIFGMIGLGLAAYIFVEKVIPLIAR